MTAGKGWLYRRRVEREAKERAERWRELEAMGYGGVGHGKPVKADRYSPLRQQPGDSYATKEKTHSTEKVTILLFPALVSLSLIYAVTAGSPFVGGSWSPMHLLLGVLAAGGACVFGVRPYRRTRYTRLHYSAIGVGALLLLTFLVGGISQDTVGTKVILNNSAASKYKQVLDDAQRDLDILKGNQVLLRYTREEMEALGNYDDIRNLYNAAMMQSQEVSDRWNILKGARVEGEVPSVLYTYMREAGASQSAAIGLYYQNYVTPEPELDMKARQSVAALEELLGDGKGSVQAAIRGAGYNLPEQ